ncbi:MAG: N-acetylmuramoyl-L-alanine amidase, partial [Bacteroidaceae bacterium]|nr:N-acetylmuramoyl-L-alanine amidase [Bacteroidaceae bacterium]
MRKITEIIIHCSATPQGVDYTVADIDRWHRQRGFNKIGYHYVIYRDGSIHQGRPVEEIGAHCIGHNAHSIGVCYIGGL